jgi:hypothetical protein
VQSGRHLLTLQMIREMMEAVSSSETSVSNNQSTRCYIPEDHHLHTRRRENLKSHPLKFCSFVRNLATHFVASLFRYLVITSLHNYNLHEKEEGVLMNPFFCFYISFINLCRATVLFTYKCKFNGINLVQKK